MADATPRLEIVVVSFNSLELTRRCLQSVRDHAPAGTLTRLVDNASSDGTVATLRAEFPEVRVHAMAENAGFSRANNVALRQVRAPFVLLLNPDTELRAGVVEHLLGELAARADVGIAGCRLVQLDGTFDHAAKRSFPTPASALAHFTGLGRRAGAGTALAQYRAPELGEHDTGIVDAVNGAFMLVRSDAMRDVGLLDEGYWLYMEDLDWCRAFAAAGWKVLYDGRVTAIHVKGGTAGKHRALRQNVAFHRGMGRFYRKWQAGERPLVDAAVYAGIGAKLLASIARAAVARRAPSTRRS